MAWSSLAPDGAKSVKANFPILSANTTYTQVTLGMVANGSANSTSTKDHYWNIDSNFDGRHRYINSPAYTTSTAGAVDPLIGAGMDAVLYAKRKLVGEATAQQDVQFFLKNSSQVMQMLGIRACIVFNWNIPVPTNPTVVYSHNCTLDASLLGQGLSERRFSMLFTEALPSVNYLGFGGAVGTTGLTSAQVFPNTGAVLSDVKTQNFMQFYIQNTSNNFTQFRYPIQVWAFVFGG